MMGLGAVFDESRVMFDRSKCFSHSKQLVNPLIIKHYVSSNDDTLTFYIITY